jgi:hypothetical protein
MPSGPHTRNVKPLLLIPFATLLVLHPLLLHGPSCGQDLAFHVQSWLDAAHQLRHGTLYPHWDMTAAWNAGEPRFLFYPPLSWLLGAVLTLIFPTALCPTIFIAIALLAAGFTFHKLASEFASPNAALIASTLYLANPYMLFTAFERSALAELLAAAWIPLLLLALLRPDPTDVPSAMRTVRNIAIPLALLWLTNAPAAVIGSYTLALVATLRVLTAIFAPTKLSSQSEQIAPVTPSSRPKQIAPVTPSSRPERSVVERPLYSAQTAASLETSATIRHPEASAPGLIPPQKKGGFSPWGMPLRLTATYLAAAILGLTLPAIYLLPAAYQRRYIQTAMALLPNMRYQDNFLFTRTTDAAHNAVNQTISLLALTLLLLTAAAVLTLLLKKSPTDREPVILSEGRSPKPKDPEALHPAQTFLPFLARTLALLTAIIAFLLTPLSTPIWHHLPNLAYLQFPWRLLILLAPIFALTLALLIDRIPTFSKPSPSAQDPWLHRRMSRPVTALTLLLPLALAVPAYRLYHQPCDPTDDPTHLAQLFSTHHGYPPTDEYTPTLADNDPLRSNNPAYWLANSPNDPAPNTTPTAAELNPSLDTDDTSLPDTQTLSTPSPHHFQIHAPTRSYLILNLRDYPNWDITETDPNGMERYHPAHNLRNDGLVALTLWYGSDYTLDITWRRTLDQTLGLVLSTLALLALVLTYRRKTAANPPRRPSRHPEQSEGPL